MDCQPVLIGCLKCKLFYDIDPFCYFSCYLSSVMIGFMILTSIPKLICYWIFFLIPQVSKNCQTIYVIVSEIFLCIILDSFVIKLYFLCREWLGWFLEMRILVQVKIGKAVFSVYIFLAGVISWIYDYHGNATPIYGEPAKFFHILMDFFIIIDKHRTYYKKQHNIFFIY